MPWRKFDQQITPKGALSSTLDPEKTTFVASSDGSAKPKRAGGSSGANLWKTPGWEVLHAESEYFEDATVNEAEYRGLMLAVKIAGRYNVNYSAALR